MNDGTIMGILIMVLALLFNQLRIRAGRDRMEQDEYMKKYRVSPYLKDIMGERIEAKYRHAGKRRRVTDEWYL